MGNSLVGKKKITSLPNARKMLLSDHDYMSESVIPRILKYCPDYDTDKKDCWEWIGRTDPAGYAVLGISRKGTGFTVMRVSQIVYIIHNKKVQENLICHKCDNPLCINPNHLWDGTYQENYDDMVSKNREASSQKLAEAKGTKISSEEVIRIYKDPRPARQIARDYEVSRSLVQAIKAGTRKRYITENLHNDGGCSSSGESVRL